MDKEYFDYLARPKTAWLTLNRGCNFRCPWCYGQSSNFDPKDNMSIEDAKRLVLIAKESGVESINLIGGEPTIWKDLFELVNYIHSIDLNVGLITNASLFSNDEFFEKYKNNPCDYIGASIKSVSKEKFKDTTGTDLYEQTMLGLERAMKFHNSGFSTVHNQIVGKAGTLEIARKGKELGATHMTLSLCSAVLEDGASTDEYSISLNQLVDDLMEIHPIIDELYNGKLTFEVFIPLCLFPVEFIGKLIEKGQLSSICHVHDRSGLVFDTNGDILPCNTMIGNPIVNRDHYNSGETLIKELNSEELISGYRELLRYPSNECSRCSLNQICKGGCIVNWTVFDPNICKAVN